VSASVSGFSVFSSGIGGSMLCGGGSWDCRYRCVFFVGGEFLVVVRMGREKGLRDRDVSDRCAFPLVIVGWGGFDRLV